LDYYASLFYFVLSSLIHLVLPILFDSNSCRIFLRHLSAITVSMKRNNDEVNAPSEFTTMYCIMSRFCACAKM
jgi:hypothetical protein